MNMKTTLSIAFLVAAAPAACTLTRPVPADVRVPPDLLRGSTYTAGGESPRSRYVVRMTDGHNDWEFQLPETATAYQVAVPLSIADPMIEALSTLLQQLGHEVAVETTADD